VTSAPTIEQDEPGEGVSTRVAARLREAMNRLLAGRPQRTDGRLIKDNLYKEAGVSRATMNRAHRVMAEWDTRITDCGGLTPGEARKHDELLELRAKLADKTRECTQLHQRLDAAATAIAALHHDNSLLRQELDLTGAVVSLEARRATPRHTTAGPERPTTTE
jgi:hypothetical protein